MSSSWTALRTLLRDPQVLAHARLVCATFPLKPWRLWWLSLAECVDRPEPFFPTDRGRAVGRRRARAICAECVVLQECGTYIADLEASEGPQDGVWAGETARERARRRST